MPVMVWSGARPLTPQDDIWGVVLLCVVIGIPAIGTAFYMLHCRVVADASGLSIYGWHRRRFITWNALEDFELRFPTSNESGVRDESGAPASRAYIKSGGKWQHISDLYVPRQLLLERIEREAKWARAKSWQLGAIRDDGEWPKIFEYRDVSGWTLAALYFGFTLTLFGLIFLKNLTYGVAPMLASLALTWNYLSFWGRVGFIALPLGVCGLQPLLILAQYPAILTRRRYIPQKITATRDGISIFKNGGEIFARWDEITSYHL